MPKKLCLIVLFILTTIHIQATSFTDSVSFLALVSNETTLDFSGPQNSAVGATFTPVQNGTFNPSAMNELFAAQGVVFGEDVSELGIAHLSDNAPGIESFSGTDGILVGNFGADTPSLGAYFVDPSTALGNVSPVTVSAVGSVVVSPGNVTLFVYDTNGSVIESVSRNGTGFLGITSNTPIAAAGFAFNNRSSSGVDTFIFTSANTVPEPSSGLLFALAILGLAFKRNH